VSRIERRGTARLHIPVLRSPSQRRDSVGGFEGSEEVRRIERSVGRIWCSYIIQLSVMAFTETKDKRCAERTHIRLHEQSIVLNERMGNLQHNLQAGPAVRISIEFRMAVMSLSLTQRTKYGSKFCKPASYCREDSAAARFACLFMGGRRAVVRRERMCLDFSPLRPAPVAAPEPAGARIERGGEIAAEFSLARFPLSSSYLPVEVGKLVDRG